jgi:hypothetical protein
MAHGSLVYGGTENEGRVLPVALHNVLMGVETSHWLDVDGDGDGDGLMDAEEAYFHLDPDIKDTDGDGVPDGRELARTQAARLEALPEGPLDDQVYVIHYYMRGVYQCLVCGEIINMGYMTIINPVTGEDIDVPYYTHHFMKHGSFSTDRPSLYPRIDPRDIDQIF